MKKEIKAACGVVAVLLVAGCGPAGSKTAGHATTTAAAPPATASAAPPPASASAQTPASKPAAPKPAAAGPGTDCGVVGGGVTARLVVTQGHITCREALAVARKYAKTPGQGSGHFANFDGWGCARNSVAEIQRTGIMGVCGRDDKTAAFEFRGRIG